MRFDLTAIRDAQRKAFARLAEVTEVHHVIKHDTATNTKTAEQQHVINPFHMDKNYVTEPAMLCQELAWSNQNTIYTFDFSSNAPAQTPGTNNNVVMPKNNIFVCYGIQLLQGQYIIDNTGNPNSAGMIYRAHGLTQNDDSMYNSTLSMKLETDSFVDFMPGQGFRDVTTSPNEYWTEIGLQLINPMRMITGQMGTFKIILTLLNPLTNLTMSPNLVVSMRLWGAMGQAKAIN